MLLHTNAVAKNCSAGVRTGGIDRDNSDGLLLLAIMLGQVIDQRAFAGAGRARQADCSRFTCVREYFLEQINPSGRMVLDRGDRAGQHAEVTGANEVNQMLLRTQRESVKKT